MSAFFLMVAYEVDLQMLTACERALQPVLTACQIIAPTYLTIALLIGIGRGFLSGNGLTIDSGPIVKALFLFFLLYFYSDLMGVLGTGLGAFPGVVQRNVTMSSPALAIQHLTSPLAMATTPGSPDPSPMDFVQQASAAFSSVADAISNFSIMSLLTRFFTTTLVLLIRNVFFFVRQFVLGFLYVSGPIVISLSMIPAFSGLAKSWLQNYISVSLWSLTFVLLDAMYSNYADVATAGSGGLIGNLMAGQSNDKFTIMSITFIILYCMVPWLTSLIIGSSTAQGFASQVASMAVGAATGAATMASPPGRGPDRRYWARGFWRFLRLRGQLG
jgi:hypothetical protein